MKKYIVCDLDGTIALNTHRQYLIDKTVPPDQKRNWDEFTRRSMYDSPNKPVIELLRRFSQDRVIIIMTGRSEAARRTTEIWLDYFRVPYTQLIMRKKDDHRHDIELKPELLEEIKDIVHFGEIDFFIDDRQTVVDRWRQMGFTVFQVAPGEF